MSDGCNKMTGWKNGVWANLERLVGHPLQRVICFHHHAERPFASLFEHYDGPTTGPRSFKGPIGQSITKDVWVQEVRDFEAFENPQLLSAINSFPVEVLQNLSTDHRNFVILLKCVLTGEVSEFEASKILGKVVQSRWTNTQTRILRHYMSSENPSFELKRLVNFIVFVYAPAFLAAKHFNNIKEGPVLLLQEVKAVDRFCLDEEKVVVERTINMNGFYAHGESVLVSLLCSDDPEDRRYAISTIKKIRSQKAPSWKKYGGVRPFKRPQINFKASSLIDLNLLPLTSLKTEPPLTSHIKSADLEALLLNPLQVDLPLATTSVERAVKQVTSAATRCSDPSEQDGCSFLAESARKRNTFAERDNLKWNV